MRHRQVADRVWPGLGSGAAARGEPSGPTELRSVTMVAAAVKAGSKEPCAGERRCTELGWAEISAGLRSPSRRGLSLARPLRFEMRRARRAHMRAVPLQAAHEQRVELDRNDMADYTEKVLCSSGPPTPPSSPRGAASPASSSRWHPPLPPR